MPYQSIPAPVSWPNYRRTFQIGGMIGAALVLVTFWAMILSDIAVGPNHIAVEKAAAISR